MHVSFRQLSIPAGVVLALALAGCGEQPQMNPGLPQVSVITVQPETLPMRTDLPGRVDAVRDAQIRARVTGIVQKIEYEQGSDVKEGQILFRIDPALYRAQVRQAEANLLQARADLSAAAALAKRYQPLVEARAVSRQEYDNAVAGAKQGEASVAAAQAALETARINLGYTSVTAPIAGRIGEPLVTEGALVEGTQATQMALVQQLDPIYVDFTQSVADLAKLRQALASGQLQRVGQNEALATLVLDDGSEYARPGKLLFTGVTVDQATSQVKLRAEFPNPDNDLLPGMYVRVRLEQGIEHNALAVPQQALQRTPDGGVSVVVVKDKMTSQVPVKTGGMENGRWIITEGLSAGDVVVVEGFQKIRPGVPVVASAWKDSADPAIGGSQLQQSGQQSEGDAPAAQPAEGSAS
ncbi:MAG: efflux RND transporter periplasmic adaptor subunit [Corticimicrobacter sp.]|uniref:efflux RND transporter periplasmic adaptor subunit n=1 Tax=Corticimicrobacter sp. TaxID=2678536 RepID=UPI0032DA751C